MRKIACFTCALLLVALLCVPVFADGANSDGQFYVWSGMTTQTMTGVGQLAHNGSTRTVRPIASTLMAVRESTQLGKIVVDFFPVNDYDQDYTGNTDGVAFDIITNVTDPRQLDIQYFKPYEVYGGWLPSYITPYGYWDVRASGGITYDDLAYSSLDTFDGNLTTPQGGIFNMKCYTSADQQMVNQYASTIAVQYYYTPPAYQGAGTVNLGSSVNLSNRKTIYNALLVGGYHTLVLTQKTQNNGTYDVYLQWVGYQGDRANYQINYKTQNLIQDLNTQSSYQAGYDSGRAEAMREIASVRQEAYAQGYDDAQENSGLIPSAILAVGEIPFQMFREILDFEIFGFDLSILVSLITTSVAVIWIVKLFL